ncbi:pirin [Hymenobacter volaticus]|nr:pirin [Hymenobacter volaticus]
MIKQTPGTIYLAEQRGLVETSEFRRYSTFNFGPYAHEHKTPFGNLCVVNEETLGGGQHLEYTVEQASYIILIPIIGEVTAATIAGSATVGVEQLQLLTVPANTTVQLTNPYETELVTFLQLWVRAEWPIQEISSYISDFQLTAIEKQLFPIVPSTNSKISLALPFAVSIGRFAGRQEVVYQLENQASFFAFVLAGAFEAQGRLLQEKDGLALWNTKEVELEALSNNALLVVIELNKQLTTPHFT